MGRESLLEYFQAGSRPGAEIAVAWRSGYRTRRWRYSELLGAAANFAGELERRGIGKGDRVLLWGENCGPWVAAFLGCMFAGAVAVPMDVIAETGFARRVAEQAGVKLGVVDRGLRTESFPATVVSFAEAAQGTKAAGTANTAAPKFSRADPVEIVFTSGTTAEPRGVVLTHGNLLANLEPLEKEMARYRRYERMFHPLRFLTLLPLSHVFGQLMGIFIPQMLGGTSVFLDTLNPAEAIRGIRDEKVSVLVTVPRLVESLRDHLEREFAAKGQLEEFRSERLAGAQQHFLWRWWRFRALHRRLGWKFWAIVSGGAALAGEAEAFWTRLGFAVIQGYGLTETTSLVSVNHPFRPGRGSIGKSLPGLEVKLSEDGEILVRGENVASYWRDSGGGRAVDGRGWFHTGDLGERDRAGNLYFKGRRKNVIVTPEGLNVFPEDLEAELRRAPAVRDAAVIGIERDGNAGPCAVLLLRDASARGEAEATAAAAVREANARLAPYQHMRCWVVWPEKDFPRTATQKPALAPIREFAEAELGNRAERKRSASSIEEILGRITGRPASGRDEAALGELTSIERVELLSALEDRYQMDLSETEFTNADSRAALEKLLESPPTASAVFHFPRWPRAWPARWLRAAAFPLFFFPTMLARGWPKRRGRENLKGVRGPALVISNHITHLDPAFVLAALPGRLRRRTAVAMDGERLEAMRTPPASAGFFRGLVLRAQYWLIVALFYVFPLPKRAGFRRSFAFAGELVDRGWSVLIFPEGELTADGRMAAFRAGIGLLASSLRVPVVPVRIDGLWELKQAKARWARPGKIRVTVGAPVEFGEEQPAEEVTQELERRVAELAET